MKYVLYFCCINNKNACVMAFLLIQMTSELIIQLTPMSKLVRKNVLNPVQLIRTIHHLGPLESRTC